jgi:hypothetical protein
MFSTVIQLVRIIMGAASSQGLAFTNSLLPFAFFSIAK